MEQDIKKTVANNLIYLRKSKNMTQSDVARLLNYSDKSVSKWEHADSLPDISILAALCDIYGVTLDYLTHENTEEKAKFIKKDDATDKSNRLIILLISITTIWLIATLIFIYSIILGHTVLWQSFMWAVPACFVACLYYNSKWIHNKKMSAFALSALCWSLLACIYVQFLSFQLWLIFILGIPIQIIILLATNLNRQK